MTATLLVVGRGPVARSLGAGLGRAGIPFVTWSPSQGRGQIPQATTVVISVRDEAIAEVAETIVLAGKLCQGGILLHNAGSLAPTKAFARALAHGPLGGIGLLHPLRSITTEVDLSGTVFGICGDAHGGTEALRLCKALSGIPLPLSEEQLAGYHAAAVLCAGHVAALLSVGVKVLRRLGLSEQDGAQALSALCRSVTENIDRVGLPQALTGPVARGDVETVLRHLHALPGISSEAAALYRAILPSALALSQKKGATSKETLEQIAALLNPPPKVS